MPDERTKRTAEDVITELAKHFEDDCTWDEFDNTLMLEGWISPAEIDDICRLLQEWKALNV